MDCKIVRKSFGLYIDGKLDETHEYIVANHITRCAECSRAVGYYRAFRAFKKIGLIAVIIMTVLYIAVNVTIKERPRIKKAIKNMPKLSSETKPVKIEAPRVSAVEKEKSVETPAEIKPAAEPPKEKAPEKKEKKVVSNIIIEAYSRDSVGDTRITKDFSRTKGAEIVSEDPLTIKLDKKGSDSFIRGLDRLLVLPEGTIEKVDGFTAPLNDDDEVFVKIQFIEK